MKFSTQVKPITYLKSHAAEIVKGLSESREPLLITQNGEAKLVVMDVKMPVMDGITAATAIAEDRIAPVVMLTAFSQRELVDRAREAGAMAYVVKPFDEGSSVGVVVIRSDDSNERARVAAGGRPDDIVMAERYVAGRELTCAVIGDFVSEIIEIVPLQGLAFYDFEAKYAPGGSRHDLPAKIKPDVYQMIRKYTLAAHQALGCRGVSRADFRLDDTAGGTGELVCLEVNTQPGMTGTSLVPELAQAAGWSFGELVRWIVEDASCNR